MGDSVGMYYMYKHYSLYALKVFSLMDMNRAVWSNKLLLMAALACLVDYISLCNRLIMKA